ncbi:zinc finger MYM-type protein 1-like [Melanaphis sacchari]|uniref:zinc finger MYM-type protein 1-like n=1 Tax=Melanaphis sacchari TaxID=742174 RepID=UPI000DC14C2C|nr:zinc finger MYM-type protein 1-like [Melanaphis sacchari]
MESKRKRFKLECLDCGSVFNNDYKLKHERDMHQGKKVKIQHFGAPSNPFAASKQKKNKELQAEESCKLEPKLCNVVPQTSNKMQAEEICEPEPKLCNVVPQTSIEMQSSCEVEKSPESSLPSTIDGDNENSWITCVGHLEAIKQDFSELIDELTSIKNTEFPNPIHFLIKSSHSVTSIKTKLDNYVTLAKIVLDDMTNSCNDSEPITASNNSNDAFVDHDPGKRVAIQTSCQRQFLISLGPYQPKLSSYPKDTSISAYKQQQFTSKWFIEYPMLEYSIFNDSVYCFVCTLFPHRCGHSKTAWVVGGVRQWQKMKSRGKDKQGKLAQHFSSASHKEAMLDYCAFTTKSNNIDVFFNKQLRQSAIREKQEQAFNKDAVSILIDLARTLARQGLAFRSHNEGANELQDGNFYQMVLLLSRHNAILKRWLNDKSMRSHKVTYLSMKSQNEFIELLAAETRKNIVEEVLTSDIFSVLADTTPDVALKDQLSVCLRYVDQGGSPNERLLDVIEVSDKTGYGMAKSIYDTLIKHKLKTGNVAFQSYDYASSMSGVNKGAQRYFSELVGHKVPYIPCQAHRLNTFLEHGCKASLIIGNFIDILENIYVFFSASTKRSSNLMERMDKIEGSLKLRNLSKTRWTARAESIKAVWTSLEAIVDTLEYINNSNSFDNLTKTKAIGLKKKILNFDFFVSLIFMKNIMYKVKHLTESLEAKELNVCDAAVLIKSTISSLEKIRLETENMDNLINSAKITAQSFGVDSDTDFNRYHRIRKRPKRLDENTDNSAPYELLNFYRQHFNLVLDTLINLSSSNLNVFVETIQPMYKILSVPLKVNTSQDFSEAFFLFPPMSHGAKLLDYDAVAAEWEILATQCLNENLKCIDVLQKSEEVKHILPCANWFCRLSFTSPVTTASSERTFSKLKLIKQCLRSTMTSNRLSSLMILSCEKDIVDKLDIDSVVTKWSLAKQRRINI